MRRGVPESFTDGWLVGLGFRVWGLGFLSLSLSLSISRSVCLLVYVCSVGTRISSHQCYAGQPHFLSGHRMAHSSNTHSRVWGHGNES